MRHAQLFFLLLFFQLALFAQPGSVSQAEVDADKAFIEAKQAMLLGNPKVALDKFVSLAEKNPNKAVLHYEIGRIYYTLEQNDQAIVALERAFSLDGQAIYAGLLGDLYQATGQYKKGAKLFADLAAATKKDDERSSSAIVSSYEQLKLQQALFLVKAQQIDKAINIYDELEKIMGINPELSRRKHALYLGIGEEKKAEKELLSLIEQFPRDLDYRHLLAGYYTSQGNTKAAQNVYQEILTIEPADVKAQLALVDKGKSSVNIGENSGQLMDLISRTDVALDLKVGKLLPMVQAVANTGDLQIAQDGIPLVKELMRVHPTEAKPSAMLGDLYYHSGQFGQAAEAYQATLALDDTVYPVWEQYLHSLYLGNQMKKLRSVAEDALDVFPNRPYVSLYLALGEAGRADYEEASSLLEQAIFIFSAAGEEQGKMARNYQNVINTLAVDELPAANALPLTEGPMGQYVAALRAFDTGAFQEALTLLQADDDELNTNALYLELLGDCLLKTSGDKTAAAAAYERAKTAGSISKQLNKKIQDTKS